MAVPLTIEQAEQLSREKQTQEALLARTLYNKFNEGAALSNLQKLALDCIGTMLSNKRVLEISCETEGLLGVWNKIAVPWRRWGSGGTVPIPKKERVNVDRIEEEDPKDAPVLPFYANRLEAFYAKAWDPSNAEYYAFSASDVSDIIRLFGQWVEDGGDATVGLVGKKEKDAWGKDLTPSNAVKDAYRPGVMQGVGNWQREVEEAWGDGKGRFAGVAVKRRDRKDLPDGTAIESHVDFREDTRSFAGIQGKQAQNDSNVLKIDLIFGLLVACDISGTTADTVFALHTVGRDYLTAAYYMLPLATIVHNHHHSLIEVALALTLNGVMNYEIGFYSTLLKKGTSIPGELVGIDAILKQYEGGAKHFVLHYRDHNTGGLAGGYLLSSDEVAKARKRRQFEAASLLQEAPRLPRYLKDIDVRTRFLGEVRVMPTVRI